MLSVNASESSLEVLCYEATNIPTHFFVFPVSRKGGKECTPACVFFISLPLFWFFLWPLNPKLLFWFMTSSSIIIVTLPPTHRVVTPGWEVVMMKDDFFFLICVFVHVSESPWSPEGSHPVELEWQAVAATWLATWRVCWELISGPLQEHHGLLNTELSLQTF